MSLNPLGWPSHDLPLLWIPNVPEHQSSEALGSVQDKWCTWHRTESVLDSRLPAPRCLNRAWLVSCPFPHSWPFTFFSTHTHTHTLEQCYAWQASLTNKHVGMWDVFFFWKADLKVETDWAPVKLSKQKKIQVTCNMLAMQLLVLCCLL